MQHPTGTQIQYHSKTDERPQSNGQPCGNSPFAKTIPHSSPCIISTQNRRRLGTHQQEKRRHENPSKSNKRGRVPRDWKTPRLQVPNQGSRQTKIDKGNGKLYKTPFPRSPRYRGNRHIFLHTQARVSPIQKGRIQPHSMIH